MEANKIYIQEKWGNTLMRWNLWAPPAVMALLLIIIAQYNFLTFHTLAELFAIVISFVMFAFAWSTRVFSKNNFLLFLACGYFWVGSLDLIHALVYKGVDIIVEGSGNLSVQFWIGTRYSEALLLLAASFIITKKQNGYFLFTFFGLIAIGLMALIFSGNFPTGFVEGKGLTDFKIYSEYLIILILLLALISLLRQKKNLSTEEKSFIAVSIVMTMFAEMAFTFYVSIYGISNLAGHIFKLFSYWFIFQAIVISNLKRPYSELREREERFRDFTDTASDWFYEMNESLRFTFFSNQFTEFSGIDAKSLIGKTRQETGLDIKNESVRQNIEDMEARRPFKNFEHSRKRSDGSIVHMSTSAIPVFNMDGSFKGYRGTGTNITERKRAEGALLKMSQAVEQSSATVVITDLDGNIEYVNRKFVETTGYSAEEAMGKNPRILQSGHTSPEEYETLWKTIAAGKEWHGKFHNKRKDGSLYWEHANISPIKAADGTIMNFVAIKDDITERVALEEKLRQTYDELELKVEERTRELSESMQKAEAATRVKSEFLANMSHEIRTPMNGVIGMLELLRGTNLTDQQKEFMVLAMHSAEMQLHVINDILDFSKIEAGKLILEELPFNPLDVVTNISSMMANQANIKGIKLSHFIAPDANQLVMGDAARLSQVITNLVSNAIKFTDDGEVSIHATVEHEGGDKVWLRFEVTDTGIGVDQEAMNALFDPFSQADSSTTRKFGGTGLGLTIATQLTELMGGRISVESELGSGSTFWIYIPFAKEGSAQGQTYKPLETTQVNPNEKPAVPTYEARVLLVEDAFINREVACGMLAKVSIEPDIAKNGCEAVEKITANTYDLVLMDVQMPEMDGLEATRQIRKHEEANSLPRTPIIAMTALAMAGDRDRCLESGMDDYIAKPVREEELIKKMDHWLMG